MQQWFAKMNDKWSSLVPREKFAITGAIFFSVIVVFYIGILLPYQNYIVSLRAHLRAQTRTLAAILVIHEQLSRLPKASMIASHADVSSPAMLLSLLQNQIAAENLMQYQTGLHQSGDDSVVLQFKKIEFDKMLTLVIDLIRKQGVTVKQLSVDSAESPGWVSADILIA